MEKKRRWWNVENPNWETRIIDFQRTPAFFIPFLPNKENLLRTLELYNNLLKQGIPSFWRTFGINGYILSKYQYEFLLKISGDEVVFGLPVEGDSSFVIISKPIGQQNSLPPILDAGSSAVIAACKGSSLLNQKANRESNVFRMSTDDRRASYYHKGIPLENLPEYDLSKYFPINPPLIQDICEELSSLNSGLNEKMFNQALVVKIDVNNSTREKLFDVRQGRWSEAELRNTSFFMSILNQLNNWPAEMYPIDFMGESGIFIFPDYSTDHEQLIKTIEQALQASSADFPDKSFTAVGIELPNVTIYETNGHPVYYHPYVSEENGWYPLEENYKNQKIPPGILLISKIY